jgi:hypothetical protein
VNLTVFRSSEFEEPLLETDPKRMCELLVGLPDVIVNGVGDWPAWLRIAITNRAGRWATIQVGRHGRSVSEVARDRSCDWHTIMDSVVQFATPLIDDPNRFGFVDALGLDETLFCRQGRWRTQARSKTRGMPTKSCARSTPSTMTTPALRSLLASPPISKMQPGRPRPSIIWSNVSRERRSG